MDAERPHGFRWRALTPAQCDAIAAANVAGVSTRDLAIAYDVSRRTIHRAIARARDDVTAEVRVGAYRAIYALTAAGPVQLTPWQPVASEL